MIPIVVILIILSLTVQNEIKTDYLCVLNLLFSVTLRLAKHLGPKGTVNDDDDGWICLPSSANNLLSSCLRFSMGFKTVPLNGGGEGVDSGVNVVSVDGGEGGYREGGGRMISMIPEGHDEERSVVREGQRVSGDSGGGDEDGLSFWSRIRKLWPRKGQAVIPAERIDAPLHAAPVDRKGSLVLVPTLVPTFAAGAGPLSPPNSLHASTMNANTHPQPPGSSPAYHHGVKPIPSHEPLSSDAHRINVIRELNKQSVHGLTESGRPNIDPSDVEQAIDTSDARLSANSCAAAGAAGGGGGGGGGDGAPSTPRPKVPPIGLSIMNSPRRVSRDSAGGVVGSNGATGNGGSDSNKGSNKGIKGGSGSNEGSRGLALRPPNDQQQQPQQQPLRGVGSISSFQHQIASPRSNHSHMAERIQGAFSGAFSHLSTKSNVHRDPSLDRAARHEKELLAMANKFNYLIIEVTDASNLGMYFFLASCGSCCKEFFLTPLVTYYKSSRLILLPHSDLINLLILS